MDAMNSEFYPPRKNNRRPDSAKAQWRPARQKESVSLKDRWQISSRYSVTRAILHKLSSVSFWLALIIPGHPLRQDGRRQRANAVLLIYLLSWFFAIYFWGSFESLIFQLILIAAHTYSLIYILNAPTRYWNRNERIGLMIGVSLFVSLIIYGNFIRFLNESVIQTHRVNGQNSITRNVPEDFQPTIGQSVMVQHGGFHSPGIALQTRGDTMQILAGPGQTVKITSAGYSIDHGTLIPISLAGLSDPIELKLHPTQWFGWSETFLQNFPRIPQNALRQTLIQLCMIQTSEITGVHVQSWFGTPTPFSNHSDTNTNTITTPTPNSNP